MGSLSNIIALPNFNGPVILSVKISNRKHSYTTLKSVINHLCSEFQFPVDLTFQDKLTFQVIPRFPTHSKLNRVYRAESDSNWN